MSENLNSMVQMLAELQAELRGLEHQLEQSYSAWLAGNNEVIARRDRVKHAVEELDAFVRTLARSIFWETGDKRPHRSVSVYVQRKLRYDEDTAREWALEMGRDDLLSIRRGEFSKAVKSGAVPEDVARYEDEAIVRIDPLGEYALSDEDTQPLVVTEES